MSKAWFQAIREDGSDASCELLSFAEVIGLQSSIPGRYSLLLLLQLFGAMKSGMLNPSKISHQIQVLEGIQTGSGLKASTPFRHQPLRGLWHQHYLPDGLPSIAININKGLHKFGLPWFEQKIAESKASGEIRYISLSDVPHIANDAVTSNWERLKQQSALTGEWIIFAKYEEKNYYLSIGEHNGDHLLLRQQIEAICLHEFPFLENILNAESA